MNTWFCKQLGDGILAHATLAQMRESFLPRFAAAGNPASMAVFTRSDSEGHLHCEVTAYFSPDAASVAQIFDARRCATPQREGLSLLAGDPRCWAMLFARE